METTLRPISIGKELEECYEDSAENDGDCAEDIQVSGKNSGKPLDDLVRIYINDSEHQLLSRQEEIKIGRKMLEHRLAMADSLLDISYSLIEISSAALNVQVDNSVSLFSGDPRRIKKQAPRLNLISKKNPEKAKKIVLNWEPSIGLLTRILKFYEAYEGRFMDGNRKSPHEKTPEEELSVKSGVFFRTLEKAKVPYKGYLDLRNYLAVHNTRLVVSIAKKFRKKGVPFLDIIGYGNLGLLRGLDSWNHRKGYKVSTYVTWWIRQAIKRNLEEHEDFIRLPNYLQKVKKALKNKESSSPEEASESTDIPVKIIERLSKLGKVISYDASMIRNRANEGDSLIDLFPSPDSENPLIRVLSEEKSSKSEMLLNSLPLRSREILKLRFGFYGREYSLQEIGNCMKISRERVRQIETRSLGFLRILNKSKYYLNYET